MDNKIVTNISQYLELVTKSMQGKLVHTPYFRGHANKSWDLCPASIREFNTSQEFRSYTMAIKNHPELFRECKSRLEEFVVLQHYGLPTCLLDITSNPLVALYFACLDSENNSDGCIYSIRKFKRSERSVDLWIELMLSLRVIMGEHYNMCFSFKDAVKALNLKEESHAFLFEHMAEAKIVIPPQNNARIRAQSGAFLLSGFDIYDTKNNIKEYQEILDNNSFDVCNKNKFLFKNYEKKSYAIKFKDMFDEIALIPNSSKSNILKELDMCGINEATLFPEPEHQMQYIKNKIQSM